MRSARESEIRRVVEKQETKVALPAGNMPLFF
jgi:hypothetical protein